MSKLKQLFSPVNEVKEERSKSNKDAGLFSYVPDSVLNHKNNKQDNSPDRRGKSDMAGHRITKGKGRLRGARGSGDRQFTSESMGKKDKMDLPPGRYTNSPNGQKGVQFEDATVETRDEFNQKAYSSDTDPLVTDSYSGESEIAAPEDSDGEHPTGYVKLAGRVINEQWGYDPRRLNRIKFRRERELEEFNFGINFANLKFSKGEQQRLRMYLH